MYICVRKGKGWVGSGKPLSIDPIIVLCILQSYLRQIGSLKYYETVMQFKDIKLGIGAHNHHLHQGVLLSSYILQYYPMSTYNTTIQRA